MKNLSSQKCPNCGALLKSFASECPYCKSEIKNQENSKALNEFVAGLNKIKEKSLPKYVEKTSLLKKVVGKDFNTAEKEEFEAAAKEKRDDELANYIRNFPIPNSREDLLEFMILVTSNINLKEDDDNTIIKAWESKMEQIMKKASLSINNASDLNEIKEIYDKKKKEINNKKLKEKVFFIGLAILYILLMVALYSVFLAIGCALFILAILIFIHSKLRGEELKIYKFNISQKIINIICIVLIILAVFLSTTAIIIKNKKSESYKNYYNENIEKYDVEVKINFVSNLLFNKYNVELTLYDNEDMLYHGKDKTIKYKLPKGKHILEFTGDGMIKKVELNVKGNMKIEYKLSCKEDEILVIETNSEYFD